MNYIPLEAVILSGFLITAFSVILRDRIKKFGIPYFLGIAIILFGFFFLCFDSYEYKYELSDIALIEHSETGEIKHFFEFKGELFNAEDLDFFQKTNSTFIDSVYIYTKTKLPSTFSSFFTTKEDIVFKDGLDKYILRLNKNGEQIETP